ncbi:hypothetical protein FS749_006626 [Ceratobasidium sp. UAMH 11750]|nr:hypothetical protein FS749_006626 [Ceratobasidium sp. UAMH 11750]
MLMVLLLTVLVGVALVVTLPPSFVCVLSNLSFGDILVCTQTAVIVYTILLNAVIIPYGPAFRALVGRPLAALAKVVAEIRRVFSLATALYRRLCGMVILRVVVCFLVVFLFCLVKLVALSILSALALVVRRATWWFIRRVVAPCILSALSAPIRLTCRIGMYGCTVLEMLWKKMVTLSLSISLRLLGRLCEPWSAPPGAFAIAMIDKADKECVKPTPSIRVFCARGYRTKGIKLPLKQLLSRREKFWDTLSDLPGCTDQFTVATNDPQQDNGSKESHDVTTPTLASAARNANPVDASSPTVLSDLCSTTKDNKTDDEPKECEQATSTTSTPDDTPPASEDNQGDFTIKYPKALVPRSSIGSIPSLLSSPTSMNFDRSTASPDTTGLSLAPSSSLPTPASSATSLVDSECTAPPRSEEIDKPGSTVDIQTSVDSAPPAKPDAPTQLAPEPSEIAKLLINSRAPPPPKFKLPAKFSLSMSCGLFKAKVAPQPKSLPDLPLRLRPCSGVKMCECECDRDVSPLARQLEKLGLRSRKSKLHVKKAGGSGKTPAARSVPWRI